MGIMEKLARQMGACIASQQEEGGSSFVKTGFCQLDWALGGGVCRNRLNIFAGQSGSGKSTLAVKIIAKLLQENPEAFAFIIDTEYYYHGKPERIERLRKIGVDTDRLIIKSTNDPSQAFQMLYEVYDAIDKDVKCCGGVIDSFGGVLTEKAIEKIKKGEAEAGGNQFGGTAKLIADTVRLSVRLAAEKNCTIIGVQHAMQELGVTFGQPKIIVKGGQTLRLLSDNIVLFETVDRKDSKIDSKGEVANTKTVFNVGKTVRAKVDKGRDVMEGRKAELVIEFATGKTLIEEEKLFDMAASLNIIYHPAGDDGKASNSRWGFKNINGEEFAVVGRPKILTELQKPEVFNHVFDMCMDISTAKLFLGDEDFDMTLDIQEE